MPQSTRSAAGDKPAKPYPDFPLFPHAAGVWAKKIRGRMHYFGPWSDPKAALQKYLDERDDLHAGRKPRAAGAGGLTVRELCNRFLTSKKLLAESGEITPRTFSEYHASCEAVVAAFGRERLVADLAADDFEQLRASLARTRGPVALGNAVQRVRVVFKYAFDAGLVELPVRCGPAFRRPGKKVLRKERAARPPRMYEAEELRKILAAATQPLKTMILLGINAGFGNADCGTLPRAALDLEAGWVNYPRPKTGISRRCPLWPETVEALREALAGRPTPKDASNAGLVFVTKHGGCWFKGALPGLLEKEPAQAAATARDNPLSKEFAKLLSTLGLKRVGINFYSLRHTFETVGGEARDQAAVDLIMGHAREDMASIYRERISDERLRAVTDYVRAWLFPPPARGAGGKEGRKTRKKVAPER
jgi:integrase